MSNRRRAAESDPLIEQRAPWLDPEDAIQEVSYNIVESLRAAPAPLAEAIMPIAVGGKRIRSRAVWWCSALGGEPRAPEAIRLMTSIELLHLATLVHDDIIDRSPKRRNHPSVHNAVGEPAALLLGDRLIGASFRMAASVATGAFDELGATLMAMCDAQYLEISSAFNLDRTLRDVEDIARGKTGRLFQAAYTIGAQLAGVSDDLVEVLGTVGMDIGTAFQLIDDLRDFRTDSDDIEQGNYTSALLLTLDRDSRSRGILEGEPRTGHSELLTISRRVGALTDAAHTAIRLVSSAEARLASVRDVHLPTLRALSHIGATLTQEAKELARD